MAVSRKGRVFAPLSKGALTDSGEIAGYAARFHNLDDGGDIIEPGFFADVLPTFLRDGFMSWSHDWSIPCGVPLSAREDASGLAVRAKFHSDEQSQRYRTIAAERLESGLTVGLSVGYEIAPGGATIEADGARHLRKASRLFEFAIVTVPMNRDALATSVKSAVWTTPSTPPPALGRYFDAVERVLDRLALEPVRKTAAKAMVGPRPVSCDPTAAKIAGGATFTRLTASDLPTHVVDRVQRVLKAALRDGSLASIRDMFGGVDVVYFRRAKAGDSPSRTFNGDAPDVGRMAGFVEPAKPSTVWLSAEETPDEIVRTLLHELVHVHQHAYAEQPLVKRGAIKHRALVGDEAEQMARDVARDLWRRYLSV